MIALVLTGLTVAGCSKGSGSPTGAMDAATDGTDDGGLPACADDGGAGGAGVISGTGVASDIDEFGPNAPVAKMVSSIGRLNVYAANAPRMLDQVDVYLGAALPGTRVTIGV